MSSDLTIPSDEEIANTVNDLRNYFNTGDTKSYEWRVQQLQGLLRFLKDTAQNWADAVQKDLGQHKFEINVMHKSLCTEIQHTIDNLWEWMKPKSKNTPIAFAPTSAIIVPEPYGVVLDFIPFNYPLYLGIGTILPIIAAGNCCAAIGACIAPGRVLHKQLQSV